MSVDPSALSIVHYPHPSLRSRAVALARVDDEVRRVAARMIELMHAVRGVGLAAPQVGLSWRLFVVNASGEEGSDRVFVNPVLRGASRVSEAYDEGCLSLPGVTCEVTRPVGITIEALDEEGQPFSMSGDGLEARVWQHEYDHLEGVLIIDRMTSADRLANRRVLRELERA